MEECSERRSEGMSGWSQAGALVSPAIRIAVFSVASVAIKVGGVGLVVVVVVVGCRDCCIRRPGRSRRAGLCFDLDEADEKG